MDFIVENRRGAYICEVYTTGHRYRICADMPSALRMTKVNAMIVQMQLEAMGIDGFVVTEI